MQNPKTGWNSLLYNSQNVGLADNGVFLAVHLHFGAAVLGADDTVAFLQVHLHFLAVHFAAGAHRDNAGNLGLLLGFGSQPPAPEWGLMLNEGRQQLQTAPWLMFFPGLAIFVTVVVFNLWGDNLRDVLDPRGDVED